MLQEASDQEPEIGDAAAGALAELLGSDGGEEGNEEQDIGVGDDQEGQEPTPDETGDELTADPEAEAVTTETESEAAPVTEAPSDFNAEEKAAFETLTPEQQKFWAEYASRSQTSRTDTANELDNLKKSLSPVGDALKPFEPYLNQLGERPENAVSGLMNYYVRLGFGTPDQKRATIDEIARTFGVEMGAPKETESDDVYVDPAIERLTKQVEQLSQGFQRQTVASQQTAVQKSQAEIDAFKDAKDESGALKHPHFEKLEPVMIGLKQGGIANTLDELYQKAVALDPEIQAEVQKAAKLKEQKAAEKKAAEAKKAASLNKKAKGAPAKKSGTMSVDDAAREALDELKGI